MKYLYAADALSRAPSLPNSDKEAPKLQDKVEWFMRTKISDLPASTI